MRSIEDVMLELNDDHARLATRQTGIYKLLNFHSRALALILGLQVVTLISGILILAVLLR